MDQAHLFAIGVLLAWLAGIRVYLTVFGVGIAGFFGWLPLPEALQATQSPWVLGVSGAASALPRGLRLRRRFAPTAAAAAGSLLLVSSSTVEV